MSKKNEPKYHLGMFRKAFRQKLVDDTSAKIVFLAYITHADVHGNSAWPSVGLVAEWCSMSVRTVQEALKRLTAAGLLVRGDYAKVAPHARPARHARPTIYDVPLSVLEVEAVRGDKLSRRSNRHRGEDASWGADNSIDPPQISAENPPQQMRPKNVNLSKEYEREEYPYPYSPQGDGEASRRFEAVAQEPDLLEPTPAPKPKAAPRAVKPKRGSTGDLEFEHFWTLYPRKEAKRLAKRTWDKLMGEGIVPADILAGLTTQLDNGVFDRQVRGGNDYRKHPSSWLNAGCWGDAVSRRTGLAAMAQAVDAGDYLRALVDASLEPGNGLQTVSPFVDTTAGPTVTIHQKAIKG